MNRADFWPLGRTLPPCLIPEWPSFLHPLPLLEMGSGETPASLLDKCPGAQKAQGCVGLGGRGCVVDDGGTLCTKLWQSLSLDLVGIFWMDPDSPEN